MTAMLKCDACGRYARREPGTCGGTGLRHACGNRLAPAFICIGRPTAFLERRMKG